jgi:hypothetical protein
MTKREQQRTLKRLRAELNLAYAQVDVAETSILQFAKEISPFKEGDKFHYHTGVPSRDFTGIIWEVGYSYCKDGPGYYLRAKRLLRRPAKGGRAYSEETVPVDPQFIRVYEPASK